MARRNRESSKREAGNLKTKSFILVYPFKNPWLYSRQVSDHTRTMKKLLENHQRIGRQVPELIIWLPLLHFFKVIDSIRQLWRSLIQCSNSVISLRHVSVSRHERWGGGGGREYSTRFYMGTLRPEVQPITLQYTIFDRKGTPFVHFLLTNRTLFTYLV